MFYIQRMIPVTATTTKVENEVYRHKNATDEEFEKINAFYHQVLAEDKDICDGSQKNINEGVYVNGEFHPEKEKVSKYFAAVALIEKANISAQRAPCIFKRRFARMLPGIGKRRK